MQRWQQCSICREIPDLAHESWNHRARNQALPAAVAKLVVVGAPYFNDYADRGTCTKRCPECGTVYRWDTDYDFDVASMIDTVDNYLHRLGDADGAAAVEAVLAEVARRKQQFLVDGPSWARVVLESTDRTAADKAARELMNHQWLYGEDLAFAVPALVHALVLHEHTSGLLPNSTVRKCDPGRSLADALEKVAASGAPQRALVLESLEKLAPKQRRPEIKELLILLDRAP